MRLGRFGVELTGIVLGLLALAPASQASDPTLSTLVKPAALKKVTDDKEVVTQAVATAEDGPGHARNHYRYRCSVLMRVDAPLPLTRRVLTDYQQYSQTVSFIEKADFDSSTKTLQVQGGIWSFKMHSWIRFEEKGERLVEFRVIGGHFRGMSGQFIFEPAPKDRTLVYFEGNLSGLYVPPGLSYVIERGAEIVFGVTARKMTARVESFKRPTSNPEEAHDPQQNTTKDAPKDRGSQESGLPAPRSHI